MVKNLPASGEDEGLIPGSKDALQKEMAIYSSILARKMPWTEGLAGDGPWRAKSVGSQRVRHN